MKTAVRILYELDEAMSYVGYCNFEHRLADNVVDKAAWRIKRDDAYESVMAEVERFIEALATGADEALTAQAADAPADKAEEALPDKAEEALADKADKALPAQAAE